jgi:hypothetical protein
MTWLPVGGPAQMLRLRVGALKTLMNTQLRPILKVTAMANPSYYEIRDNCELVACGYKLAAKCELFVEHYVDHFHKREYFALFSAKPISYLPLTITTNDLF